MAGRIHILPEQLANKIAAGEVVQRPASVVKELLENSLDAGATTMTLIVNDGGKTLIQVVDDGIGMNGEDAVLSFGRHATSKISSYDDLENIRTLGFRGEALASIGAVSHCELRTRQKVQSVGVQVRVEGGEVRETSEASVQPGTSVTVRNIFFNTPGRRNFLRSNNTEFKHIVDAVQRVAISHPELRITFISDGDTVFDLHPCSLDERVRDIFGEHQSEALIHVNDAGELLTIEGLVSKPDYARKTRAEQYLFLNRRYIVSRSLNHAVFQAYEHLLEKGSFPLFILFLGIDPRRIDVNVHPSKMEVKFDDERSVYRLVMNAVRKALLAQDLAPAMARFQGSDDFLRQGDSGSARSPFDPAEIQPTGSWRELLRPVQEVDKRTGEIKHEATSPRSSVSPVPHPYVWQVHSKYIVTPTSDGLMIVDQHVAHERVLYERIIERFSSNVSRAQQLLFSHTIELTPGDAALVKQLEEHLTGIGFALKFFGKSTVVLEAVPTDVRAGKETTILQELIDLYKENEHHVNLGPRENLAKSFSCKAAIKAGDPLGEQEMRSLLDQLFATRNPFVCPHGRPVIVKLSLAELDRRFGRPVRPQ